MLNRKEKKRHEFFIKMYTKLSFIMSRFEAAHAIILYLSTFRDIASRRGREKSAARMKKSRNFIYIKGKRSLFTLFLKSQHNFRNIHMFVVFIEETRDDFVEKTENVLHSFYLNKKMFPFYALLSALVCLLASNPIALDHSACRKKKASTKNLRCNSTFS